MATPVDNAFVEFMKNIVNLILSCHVEKVCVLSNKNRKPDDYLKVNIDVDKIHDILDKEKAEKEAKEKSQSE